MTAVKRSAEGDTHEAAAVAKKAMAAAPVPTNKTMPTDYSFLAPSPNDCHKIVTYNVNSLSAACKKGFKEYVAAEDPDVLCLQETKANQPMAFLMSKARYPHQLWHCSKAKKGYSGTAVFSKLKPLAVKYGFSADPMDDEGRLITVEFDTFHLVACYVPNAGEKLVRLDRRLRWDKCMRAHLAALEETKPVIYTGDLNVAHCAVDLARPDSNKRSAGFTVEERDSFTATLAGTSYPRTDMFRHLHPAARADAYTYFGYRGNCREKGIGWRLDYFVVSQPLMPRVADVLVRNQCYGASDHVPLVLFLRRSDASGDTATADEPSGIADVETKASPEDVPASPTDGE
ncbi:hypothetical protein H4R20_005669 [Coemansia guatemalensis]|uniref:Endonuclease/exonuclease/phosphatase domain-containing protein n=1 Tax=Coemansia guatemalensis TaxID=2761395 RepID=A0A9W8HTT1_9FUNG|nr:hypothetical protein H4R20_005669 [Coemansia guatemalensis]